MKWIVMVIVFVGCIFYLLIKHSPTDDANQPADSGTAQVENQTAQAEAAQRKMSAPIQERLDGQTIQTFERLLNDVDPEVRLASLDVLYKMNHPNALNFMKKFVSEDSEMKMRVGVIDMIAKQGDINGLPVLALALKDTDPQVRLNAVSALDKLRAPECIQVLRFALKDEDSKVKVGAMRAIESVEKYLTEKRLEEERKAREAEQQKKKNWMK